jgi:lipoprotein signal peptidase
MSELSSLWGWALLLDGLVVVLVLVLYFNRPKPQWFRARMRVARIIARALGIVRRTGLLSWLGRP